MRRLSRPAMISGAALLVTLFYLDSAEYADHDMAPLALLQRSDAYYQRSVRTLEMTTVETIAQRGQTEHRTMLYRYRAADRWLEAITAGPYQGFALLRTEKQTVSRDGIGKPIRSMPADPTANQERIAHAMRTMPSNVWMTNYIDVGLHTTGCRYRVTRVRHNGEATFHLRMTFFRPNRPSGADRYSRQPPDNGKKTPMEIEWWFRQRDGAAIEVRLSGPEREFIVDSVGEEVYRHTIALCTEKVNQPIPESDFVLTDGEGAQRETVWTRHGGSERRPAPSSERAGQEKRPESLRRW